VTVRESFAVLSFVFGYFWIDFFRRHSKLWGGNILGPMSRDFRDMGRYRPLPFSMPEIDHKRLKLQGVKASLDNHNFITTLAVFRGLNRGGKRMKSGQFPGVKKHFSVAAAALVRLPELTFFSVLDATLRSLRLKAFLFGVADS